VHHAVLAVYGAIAILIGTMCIIALTATMSADWVAVLVFGVFVASVLMMLLGVLLITLEIRTSQRALQYEVRRVRRLAASPETLPVTDGLKPGTFHA
jgi:Ni/Fe-hydrogenase subunit HybB-like protein